MFLENLSKSALEIIYYAMQVASFPVVAVSGWKYAPKYNIKKNIGMFYSLSIYTFLFLLMYFLSYAEIWLGFDGGLNSSRCFLLVLIPTALFSKIAKIDPLQGADFVAPALYLARATGKIGCTVYGCCHGVACSWGIYSSVAGQKVFPVQIIETLMCICIMLIVVKYASKKDYHSNGRAYGLSMIALGIGRYIVQFAVPGYGFNKQSVYAILMILLGLFVLYFSDYSVQQKSRT